MTLRHETFWMPVKRRMWRRGTCASKLTRMGTHGSLSAPITRPHRASSRIKRYRLTVHYQLDPPNQEAELLANPLGMYVNFINEAEERAAQ